MADTNEAKRLKAEIKSINDKRAGIKAELAGNMSKGRRMELRLEDARLGEDLVQLRRQLKELMPRHRVSYKGTTWAGIEGRKWDQMQFKNWQELENAGLQGDADDTDDADDKDERILSAVKKATDDAIEGLPQKQKEYLKAKGGSAAVFERGEVSNREVADTAGVDRSTVSRTISRARKNVQKEVRWKAGCMKAAEDSPGQAIQLNLSTREHLDLLLGRLSEKQALYMFLYYGEWMTLREIGDMLSVHHASVHRTIRRGLERIDILTEGNPVALVGAGTLEDVLMEYYNDLLPEDLPPEPPTGTRRASSRKTRSGFHADRGKWPRTLAAGRSASVLLIDECSGKLLEFLRNRREELEAAGYPGSGRVLRRLLHGAFRKLIKMIRKEKSDGLT